MRKPDPVELVPAQAGAPSTDSSRNATPTIARLCASTGSLSDIRRQHEAAAQTLLGGWTGERGSTEDQGRRNGVDDEDGNAEGGSASLADLFETNPRAGVSHRAWPTSLTSPSAMSAVLHENVANSDTSDDEGGLAELAELGTVTTDEGEGGLSDARTDADLDAMLSDEDSAGRAGNGKPAAKSRPEIATKETQAQGDAKSSPSKKSGPTPTLRRRSMTLPSRPIALNRTSPSENAGGNGAAERTSSSGLMPAANVRSPAFGAAASKTPLSLTTASASKTTAHTASNRRRSLSTNGASRAPGLNNSSASAGMRAKDRPASAGVGAASSSSSSNSNSSSSLPERPRTYSGASSASMATAALGVGSGANSLGRASANHRISLHSALTDPPPVPDVPGSLTRTLVPPSGNTPPRSKASPAGSNSSAPGSKNAQTPASLGITGKASPALSNASHSSRATGGASSDGSTPGNARPRVQVRQVQSSSSLPGNATARTDSQGPTASSAPASEGRRMSRRLSAVPPS